MPLYHPLLASKLLDFAERRTPKPKALLYQPNASSMTMLAMFVVRSYNHDFSVHPRIPLELFIAAVERFRPWPVVVAESKSVSGKAILPAPSLAGLKN
jgi:hypothetical protein